MRRLVSVILFLNSFLPLFSQKEIIAAVTEFIKVEKYDAANHYLDSILKKDKRNVDALMMKGNVILNRAYLNAKTITYITPDDESVFRTTSEQKNSKVLPVDTVRAVEKFWRQGLKIDSSRTDIRKGLCTIYAFAMLREDLKKEIAAMVKVQRNDDGELPFKMAEYARKFIEQNNFDDGMDVYRFIAQQFPATAGLRCDMAEEYFYEGRINDALTWLDSCYNFKTVDETSFLNGAFTYSELGYFDDAQNVMNAFSRLYQKQMDKFYFGLHLFGDSSAKYYGVLNVFVRTADSNSYSNEISIARKLLNCRDSFTLNDYRVLALDKEIPDYYKVLIHTRALKQFADNCEPFIAYGVYQTSIKNYSAAVQFLEEGATCNLKSEQKEYWVLNYGYALFMFGQKEKAMLHFNILLNSSNNFYQQSAKYFIAKILNEQKRNEEAKKLLEEIVASKEITKYGTFADALLRALEK